MKYSNPFDDENQIFYILKNNLLQYSLWPIFNNIPNGWEIIFGPETQDQCFYWLEKNWNDIYPKIEGE